MGFSVKELDITKVKRDVVVNSLGPRERIKVFGQLCTNIVKKAGKDLKDKIFSWEKDAEPGKIFTSSGYKLPSPNIIHIVTPFYVNDKQLYALEFVYKEALITAYKNGWKKIALPIIGTGANEYPHSYVVQMLVRLVNAFVTAYKEMDVTICIPINDKEDEDSFDPVALDKSVEEYFKKNTDLKMREFKYSPEFFLDLESDTLESYLNITDAQLKENGRRFRREHPCEVCCGEFQTLSKVEKISPPKEKYVDLLESGERPTRFDMTKLTLVSITNYIDEYINRRFKKPEHIKLVKKHVDGYLTDDSASSIKSKHNNEKKRTTVSVTMLMRYILALHMDQTEADDLLMFCGRVFSPVSKTDQVYKKIIKRKEYRKFQANTLCLDEKVEQIFGYEELVEDEKTHEYVLKSSLN